MDTGADRSHLIQAREPDYAIAPGETLRDVLEELDMTQSELAIRTGLSSKHVNQVLHGLVPVSAEVAQRLEYATGVPARLWNRLEADYRSLQVRLSQRVHHAENVEWLRDMPVRQLVNRGILPSEPADNASRVQQLLTFFGVASPAAWRQLWSAPMAAYRQTTVHAVSLGALASWLRLGELASRSVPTRPFNSEGLARLLSDVPGWTRLPLRTTLADVRTRLADVGVAMVFVPEIAGARVYGATRWLAADRVLVQLSGRGKTEESLWETLTHELGHVVLHPRRMVYVEIDNDIDIVLPSQGGDDRAEQERAAWAFATQLLFGADADSTLHHVASVDSAVMLAESLGIAPGIIAARLQAMGRWSYRQGSSLRRPLPPLDDLTTQLDGPSIPRPRPRQPPRRGRS